MNTQNLSELFAHLLPEGLDLAIRNVTFETTQVLVELTIPSLIGVCPTCCQSSTKIHSPYQRTLADLPWATLPVKLFIQVRRFFCTTCAQRTFAQTTSWVGEVVAYARRTSRQTNYLRYLAFAIGSKVGSRITAQFRFAASPTTLLRLVRKTTRH